MQGSLIETVFVLACILEETFERSLSNSNQIYLSLTDMNNRRRRHVPGES